MGTIGGTNIRKVAPMTTTPASPSSSVQHRMAPIAHLDHEWRTLGRSRQAVQALHRLADADSALARLVHGVENGGPPPCPTPFDLIEHMHRARGQHQREEAAGFVRLMLRESAIDPVIKRCLLQALIPGLVTVAVKLRWGRGGYWENGEDFFSELLSTTWLITLEWSGQDRPYAAMDLLSAVRCRLRRQLFRDRDDRRSHTSLEPETTVVGCASSESGLEELTRTLIALQKEGMRQDEVQVLYARYVLGYSISELALTTGRDRRLLYMRRDRGLRRIVA
jgi:hypothetical protein